MSQGPLPRIALETSVRAASVAVDWGQGAQTRFLEAERAHASDLLPVLSALLEGQAQAKDVGLIAVGTGPGSYTGLRVGIATAMGLAEASGAQLVGVPSVKALAFSHLAPGECGAVVLDARGGELYFACYERSADRLKTLHEPTAILPAKLGSLLPEQGPILVDAELVNSDSFSGVANERLVTGKRPSADAVLALGLQHFLEHGPQSMDDVRPLYLRPFAVRARKR